jgi:hypothetical protein
MLANKIMAKDKNKFFIVFINNSPLYRIMICLPLKTNGKVDEIQGKL